LPDDDQLELTRTAERLYGIQQSIDRKKEDAIVMEESGAGGNENRIV
jgi:hypothetical protein